MWVVNGYSLKMAEGDYGIQLPVVVKGAELDNADSIKVTFKDVLNGTTILEKTYNGITDNTAPLELTEEESALFPVGQYVYAVDWYQDGNFLCNLIPLSSFWVVDKA